VRSHATPWPVNARHLALRFRTAARIDKSINVIKEADIGVEELRGSERPKGIP
jgi:hypothetical protein